jgi:hypothetical protein
MVPSPSLVTKRANKTKQEGWFKQWGNMSATNFGADLGHHMLI